MLSSPLKIANFVLDGSSHIRRIAGHHEALPRCSFATRAGDARKEDIMLEGKRGRRRYETIVIGLRRRAWHIELLHAGKVENIDCVCEFSPFLFAKRKASACSHCSRRAKGRPRSWNGLCGYLWRTPLYKERCRWREAEAKIRNGSLDPDEWYMPRCSN